jgi:hypothetical protein
MGGAARDISAKQSVLPRCNHLLVQPLRLLFSKTRILDTLQNKRGVGCYTGPETS